MSPLRFRRPKDFVYFRSAVPTGVYPDESRPLAEALSNRLRSMGIEVALIQRHWEDLRMVCRFKGQLFWLDITSYVEVQPPEFSLQMKQVGRWFLPWFGDTLLRLLVDWVDKLLHSDPAFTEIRWHRSRDLRKGSSGADHPFT